MNIDAPSDLATKPDVKTSMAASERLAESRSRLKSAMQAIAHPPASPPTRTRTLLGKVQNKLGWAKLAPALSLFNAAVERWWVKHPLHDAALLAVDASRSALVPIARRNPLKLVFGSLFVGALLVIVRPWRLLFRLALLKSLLPHVLTIAAKRLPAASLSMLGGRTAAGPKAPRQ